ncbi:hypothetical protein Lnau_2283 [Legionella nautarum]|uniref:DUF3541 domain-containing protein n=1 Tax=Legionella nautarum TaxID=45070 RepID=A0A0W0WMI9_9GAMM|nr:DUF3541 domain-containing protein [Legionella nautarum]KTD33532.1 hypothetical protein Lnau_2283 [Legionella nautarum]
MIGLKISKFVLGLLICLLSQSLAASSIDIADKVQKNFDNNLFKLKPIIQSHYAVRLYRITGRKDYLYPIISFQFVESIQLQQLLEKATRFSSINFNKTISLPLDSENNSRAKKRKALLAQLPEISNTLKILLILDHAQQFNTLNSALFPNTQTALAHIKKNLHSLAAFLLNPLVIKISAAQVANFVYLLHRLDLIDLRKQYIDRFQTVFANHKDSMLTDKMFEDKIYGMTHIIIAASNYYQKKLAYAQFAWIYQYFEQHIDEILARTKADVIAEVGLSFCLIEHTNYSSSLNKIKQFLKDKFNSKQQIIPNKSGSHDLNLAEHRNILAIMLFKWPSVLYPGPDLAAATDFLSTLQQKQPL